MAPIRLSASSLLSRTGGSCFWADRRRVYEPGCDLSAKEILDGFCLAHHRHRVGKLRDAGFALDVGPDELKSEMGEDGAYWLDPVCCMGIWQDGLNDTVWADFVDGFRRSLREDIARAEATGL